MATKFSEVYNLFLAKVTDDMYMELTIEDTKKLLQDLLIASIFKFEFPRVDLTEYKEIDGEMSFTADVSVEEQNILATYMVVEWIGQQLASVEMTRLKYSGSDFKFTSQANHLQKLLTLKKSHYILVIV